MVDLGKGDVLLHPVVRAQVSSCISRLYQKIIDTDSHDLPKHSVRDMVLDFQYRHERMHDLHGRQSELETAVCSRLSRRS